MRSNGSVRGAAALRLAAGAALGLTLAACAHRPVPEPPKDPSVIAANQWPDVRRAAQTAALSRDFATADSTLLAFVTAFRGTPSASDALFYRAIIRLEAAGDGSPSAESLRDIRGWIDAYLVGGPIQEHYAEALVLRRVAARLDLARLAMDSVRGTATTAVNPAIVARDSVIKARDEELARVRTELDQTRAELDRIRRRIAPRRP